MKAIILAAGMGTRLGTYTTDLPKGMLAFGGKSLIERQVDTLRAAGIQDITIVRGYHPEKIQIPGVHYRENTEYATTNMVATLMQAHDAFLDPDGVLVCYADIIYERRLITTLLQSSADVNVLVDEEWHEYWKARLEDWRDDVESLQYDEDLAIYDIGEPRCDITKAHARYIGLIKFSAVGARKFIERFEANKKKHWESDAPWRRSKSFKKAYMTCMLQELVDAGVQVLAVPVRHGWMEFDTVEDYEKACAWVEDGTIQRFIEL